MDTGKCVDASPLLIQNDSRDPSETVYIGSHSGRFFAICFRTGKVLWESQLTDRIESSACLSVCGQYVIVGESVALISCPILYMQYLCVYAYPLHTKFLYNGLNTIEYKHVRVDLHSSGIR